MVKTISILGATGSIGSQSIDVIKNNPEHFKLGAISVGRNIVNRKEILTYFRTELVSVQDEKDTRELSKLYPEIHINYGEEGLIEVASSKTDLLLTAIMGSVGLKPTLSAIDQGTDIALANK